MKLGSLASAPALQAQPLPDARQQLRDIRNQLVHPTNGSIKSGYLRLSQRGTLNVGGWMTRGSHSQATQSIRALVQQAYAGRLSSPGKWVQIDKALDRYLQTTHNAIGSRTFVRMLDELERALPADDFQEPVRAARPTELAASHLRVDPYEHFLSAQEVGAMRGNSPIGEAALAQFEKLAAHAPRPVMEHFKSLMFPQTSALNPVGAVQGPAPARTFAMGDADGSMGRMVLHAIASGVAHLPDDALPALGAVLTAELRYSDDLRTFQSSKEVAQALDQIAQALVVPSRKASSKAACIFLGDILSDRFTNNQEAMSRMIYKLRGFPSGQYEPKREITGVRFIAGNHDTLALDRGGKVAVKDLAWGGAASRVLSQNAHRQLLFDCFQAADYSDGVLYTHNGVRRHAQGGYESGLTHRVPINAGSAQGQATQVKLECMRLDAQSPAELAAAMNQAFHQRVAEGRPLQELISTEFRPEDHEMTAQAMAFAQLPALRQVHGHNGSHNEDNPGVTNLNARDASSQFAPVGRIIEYEQAAPVRNPAALRQADLQDFLSVQDVRTMRGSSPIGEAALAQFEKLAAHAPKRVMEHFKSLMFPQTSALNPVGAVQGPAPARTFAMGDADGSMGRMVLHAIASGVAHLPDDALPALGAVLTAELRYSDDLRTFQTSKEVAQALDQVAQALVVAPRDKASSQPACIFLGDILSDRFTNNQEAMSRMIYKLRGFPSGQYEAKREITGVRFIAGNHDTLALDSSSEVADKDLQWGGAASRMLSEDAYRRLLYHCFQAADYSDGVLYTHNGVRRHAQGGYESGLTHWVPVEAGAEQDQATQMRLECVRLDVQSPAELAKAMNQAFRKHLAEGRLMTELISTNFRPEDHEMTAQAMAFAQLPALRQVHGHTGNQNEDNPGVTNLNARDASSQQMFVPTGRIIEYEQAVPA